MPIITLFFCFAAIFRISKVHFGTVKSIIILHFLKADGEFFSGLIPEMFLLIFLLSVKDTSLKILK